MCFDPLSATLAIGGAVAGVASSAAQASAQNSSIRKSQQSAQNAQAVQQQQINDSATLEKLKRSQESARIRSLLLVQAAERGVGTDGSIARIDAANAFKSQYDKYVTDQNAYNQTRRSQSELASQLTILASRRQNVLFSGLTGGLSGVSTGLQIGSGINSIIEADAVRNRTRTLQNGNGAYAGIGFGT